MNRLPGLVFSALVVVFFSRCGAPPPPGPVTVNGVTLPVADGQLLADFSGVPLFNVTWDRATPSNDAAVKFFTYSLDEQARARGATITLQVRGAGVSSFVLAAEAAANGDVLGSVRCVPQALGTHEAELVATIEGTSSVARLRCAAISDYGLFVNPGASEPPVCVVDGRLLLPGNEVYELATGVKKADASAPSCPSLPGDRLEELRAEVQADGSVAVRLADGTLKPMLTAADLQTTGAVTTFRVSPDGTAIAFATMRGLWLRDEQPLRALTPWSGTVNSRRVYGFDATGERLVVSAVPSTSSLRLRAQWLVVDRRTGATTPLLPPSLDNTLPAHGNLFAFTGSLERIVWGLGGNGSLDFFLVDRTAGTATRLFDDAMAHVRTLAGRSVEMPITLVSQVPHLTADGRYLALTLEAFTGTDYYFGPKAAYVRDLVEGKTWLVSVLPDGTPLSGDGWGYSDQPSVSADGQFAAWTVVWTAGSAGGGGRLGFSAVVPRRLWVPLSP